jgi:hypothetical protein
MVLTYQCSLSFGNGNGLLVLSLVPVTLPSARTLLIVRGDRTAMPVFKTLLSKAARISCAALAKRCIDTRSPIAKYTLGQVSSSLCAISSLVTFSTEMSGLKPNFGFFLASLSILVGFSRTLQPARPGVESHKVAYRFCSSFSHPTDSESPLDSVRGCDRK